LARTAATVAACPRAQRRDAETDIGVLVEKRYLLQGQPGGLIAALHDAGRSVLVLDPDALCLELGDPSWLAGLGVVIARGRSDELLSLLRVAELHRVPTVSRAAAVAGVRDKASMAAALRAAGIPTPRTYFGAPARLADALPSSAFPVIAKPVFGDNCRGLALAGGPAELASLTWEEPVALVQEYVASDGVDLKLYGIGTEVTGVRKASLFQVALSGRPAPPPELVELTPALADLGRRCGALFGLELWGVDCLITATGPQVIEVNEFPNYTLVPEADAYIAEVVMAHLAAGA
jgi:ribosomal protein S6--L-glutamate ligase